MPTHNEVDRFWQDWDRLTPAQRGLFRQAVAEMVEDLKAGRPFRRSLRVKRFQSLSGVYEMTWAPDGRALFTFGSSPHPGETHITWLRVGTHAIFQQP
jgi:hypothetical protein